MKATALFIVIMLTAFSSYSCDEACKKEQAEAKYALTFSGHLSWQFCEATRNDFITKSVASLEKYSSENFDARYKGAMRNIKHYIETRILWLKECDQYMRLTGEGPIFDSGDSNKAIFGILASLSQELDSLLKGVTYSSVTGSDTKTVIQEKFDRLFVAVDRHKALMHYKGRYVNR